MCGSFESIQVLTKNYIELIKRDSKYKYLGVETVGNSSGEIIISHIILEDEEGIRYSVIPDLHGLKFAKKEISYKQYKKSQRSGFIYSILTLTIGMTIIIGGMIGLMKVLG